MLLQVNSPHPGLVADIQTQPIEPTFSAEQFSCIDLKEKPSFILQKVFGFANFRQGQKEIIDNILCGKDNIALLPTGGGKSIIYSVVALLQGGIHIVVEPLKSLMEEQVKTLRDKYVTSYFVNSSLNIQQIEEILHILASKDTTMALLFTSPEWLQGAKLKQCINTLKSQGRLKNVFVDEAHCVDLWAGSFRAAYSQLGFLKHQLAIPITALSGSASRHTVKVITESVNLDKPTITKMSFYRSNLSICVIKKAIKPIAQMVNIVTGKFKESCGIIYCNKRATTKDAAHALKSAGINAVFIHGDLDDTERRQSESKWRQGIAKIACCTKTFGMGINKADVRFILHIDMPATLEDYYQEIGRAGRDGEPAESIALFSFESRNFHLQNIAAINKADERKYKVDNLNTITSFLGQSRSCRHKLILSHFDETSQACEKNCDVCASKQTSPETNLFDHAKEILKCFTSMRAIHSKITMTLLLLVLMGSASKDLQLKGLHKAENFGIGKKLEWPVKKERKAVIQKLVFKLIFDGFLAEVFKPKQAKGYQKMKKDLDYAVYIEHGNIENFYKLEKYTLS